MCKKRFFYTFIQGIVLSTVLSIGSALPVVAAVTPGSSAPQFQFKGEKGNRLSLADLQGQLVYVDFWASWCGPCRASFPWMNSIQERYGKKGFQVIGINIDQELSDAQKFLKEIPAKFPVVFDAEGKLPEIYGVKGMPTSFLIDQHGKVIMEHQGFSPADKAQLEKTIQRYLKAK